MFDVQITIPTEADIRQLDEWRRNFAAADLELPEGWDGEGVATAVAVDKQGGLIGSLTGTLANSFILDPFIINPDVPRNKKFSALFALANALEYQARMNGAVVSFVAIPNLLPEYQELMPKLGFEETVQHCRVYRRSYRRTIRPIQA